MAYVFISSRMSELATERLSAFQACHRLGHRPMMFEMQPVEGGIEPTVQDMIQNADLFVGILRDTLGPQSFVLGGLPPILYELAQFVGKFCRSRKKSGCPDGIHAKRDCPAILHDYLRGRCLLSDVPHGCVDALRKARGQLVMYAAEPIDERTVSSQVEGLLAQLRSSDVRVEYFGNRFDLFTKIVENETLNAWKTRGARTAQTRFQVSYQGKDEPGQVYELAAAAFRRRMNIEYLYVNVTADGAQKRTHIASRWMPYVERGKEVLSAQDLQRELHDELCSGDTASDAGGAEEPVGKAAAGRDALERGQRFRDKFQRAGLQVDSESPGAPIPRIVPGFPGGPHLKVRIYHLNVPGIVARISHMLAYGAPAFRFVLNIEQCVMLSPDPPAQLKDLPWGNEPLNFVADSSSFRAFQICDLLLTDATQGKDTLYSRGTNGVYELENALSSIAGVDHVVSSDWLPGGLGE